MKPFVPAFDALWRGSKAGLSHATRSIFLRLCQEVRDAKRSGEIALPSARTDLDALLLVVPASRSEMKAALAEMTAAHDPMVTIEMVEGRRVLRVLSWAEWALIGRTPVSSTVLTPGPMSDAERAARYRASKKAASRDASRTERDAHHETEREPSRGITRDGVTNGGGKGGALPPDQKREDQTRQEDTRTHESVHALARVGGRVANDATDEEDPEPTGDTTDAKVLRLLRAAPALVGYERDRLLALPECANELVVKAAHFTMGGKIREDEALDRVRAAIEDVDRKVTASLMTPHPMPGPKAAELLLSFAWTNLGKSREDWSRRKAPASSPGSDESKNADRTLEVFGEVYADRKKRDFVRAPGDERKAADVAAEAQRHAQKLHISGGEIVRHWAKGYLADKDPFVADKDHPFALFASRIGQYGLPRSPQATPKPQAPPPPEGEPGPIPRDFVDKIRTSPTDAGKEHAA